MKPSAAASYQGVEASFATVESQLVQVAAQQPPPQSSDGSIMVESPTLYHICADQLMLWDKCQRTSKTRAKMCRGPQQVGHDTGKATQVESETVMNVIQYPVDDKLFHFTAQDVAQLEKSIYTQPPMEIL